MEKTIGKTMRVSDLASYAHRRSFFEFKKRKALAWLNVEQILRTQMDESEVIKVQVPKGLKINGKKKEKEKVDD